MLRANINGGDVTEAEDGAYYVIKMGIFEYYFFSDGELPATATSDGIYVTYDGDSQYGYPIFTFTVNEPAQQTPALLTLNVAGQTIYYTTGETWRQAITNHATENAGWSIGHYEWDWDQESVINGGLYLWDGGLNDGMGGLVSPDSQVYTSGTLHFGD